MTSARTSDKNPSRKPPRSTRPHGDHPPRGDDQNRVSSKPSREDGTGARKVAAKALMRIEQDDAYANLLLPTLIDRAGLAPREAGLATELTYGTLRGQGLYDQILQSCARRSINEIDVELRPLLRMGAHQLLAMRVPSHAAVDQTVRLVKKFAGQSLSGFANAVLRKVSTRDLDGWVSELTGQVAPNSAAALGVEHSHPEWVVRALRESLVASGRPVEELRDLLHANNQAARVTVALLPGVGDNDDIEPTGQWSPHALELPPGDPRGSELLRLGHVRVQDEGSQLAALVAALAPVQGSDGEWADFCAGPGGKAAMLAALGAPRGVDLTAFELQEHRADLVRQAVAAIPARPTVLTGDSREVGEDQPEHFDRVLVDVPCTGLGALRRRPEARWRRTSADLSVLTPIQRGLLDSALDATRSGGLVTYVTCSPHPAETSLVVGDVVKRRGDVTVLDTPSLLRAATGRDIPHCEGPTIGPRARSDQDVEAPRAVQLWPHLHGTDAMFIVVLRKD